MTKRSSSRNLFEIGIGLFLMGGVIFVLEAIDSFTFGYSLFDFTRAMPMTAYALLITTIVFSLYRFGWFAAGSAAVLMLVYHSLFTLPPGQAVDHVRGFLRIFLLLFATVASLVIVGRLKASSERGLRDEAEAQALRAKELDEKVRQRTLALQDAYDRLKETDRIKTEFVSNVSHELRTPLTNIKGYAEFLEDRIGGELSSEQANYVREISDGARRLEHLVNDLLDFGRLEAGTLVFSMQPLDMADLITNGINSVMLKIRERNLQLETDIPSSPLPINGDPNRLDQVLLNLVGNAIKFTPPGGRICLTVRLVGSHVRVEVRDTGIGIAPEHLEHLFTRFYQADPSLTRQYGGAGLGLAISKAIVEGHGGRIGVESSPGQGSLFWFELPLLDQQVRPPIFEPMSVPGKPSLEE